MPYIGNQPGTGVRNRFIYTATASQTTFSGADNNSKTLKYADSNYIDVYLNGVCLEPGTDYTASTKTSVVLTQAASLNDTLKVIAYDVASMDDSISKADGGTFEANVTFADGADIITATAGTDNVRLGENAGDSIASGGTNNVTIGKDAGTAITTGDDNVAVGNLALKTNTGNNKNVAVGSEALEACASDNNTAVGYQAGEALSSGGIVAVGYQAGKAATTSIGNTLVGELAGTAITDGNNNTAVGSQALSSITSSTDNTAIGHDALRYLTTGTENVAIGSEALDAVTVGNGNVAVGNQALSTDVNGSRSVAVGATALKVQEASGSTSNNYYNVGVGYDAGGSVSTGYYNTMVGTSAGQDLTTGIKNVFIGMDSTSASASDGNQICIGYDVDCIGGNYTTLGNNSIGRVYNQFSSNASWTRTSDERIKKDIEANTDCGLAFINDLRTVTYKWKAPSEHPEEFKSYNKDITEAAYTEKMYGFIAQEVKAAMDTHNITGFNGWHVTSENQGSQQGVSYEMFVMPLVKAVQELSAKVDALETENTAIKARLDALEAG